MLQIINIPITFSKCVKILVICNMNVLELAMPLEVFGVVDSIQAIVMFTELPNTWE